MSFSRLLSSLANLLNSSNSGNVIMVGSGGNATIESLAPVATAGTYASLTGQPTIPTVPTNVSAFTNDAGYLTSSSGVTSVNGNHGAVTVSGGLGSSGQIWQNVSASRYLSNYVGVGNFYNVTHLYTNSTPNTIFVVIITPGAARGAMGTFTVDGVTFSELFTYVDADSNPHSTSAIFAPIPPNSVYQYTISTLSLPAWNAAGWMGPNSWLELR